MLASLLVLCVVLAEFLYGFVVCRSVLEYLWCLLVVVWFASCFGLWWRVSFCGVVRLGFGLAVDCITFWVESCCLRCCYLLDGCRYVVLLMGSDC